MKSTVKIFVLLLGILLVSCSSQMSVREGAISQTKVSQYDNIVNWMPVLNHNIQMSYDEQANDLLVVSYISLDKSKIKNRDLSFIIDEDVDIKSFTINGNLVALERILLFNEDNFVPPLEYSLAKKMTFFGNIWQFNLSSQDLAKEDIKLTLKYTIKNQAKHESYHKTHTGFSLKGDLWWYPTSMLEAGSIIIDLSIDKDYQVKFNNNEGAYDQIRSYKFYNYTADNSFINPVNINAIKNLENKL